MKPYLTVLFILFSIASFAQKADSLEIRLTQFKSLLDKKLISQEEYDKLKAKELGFENKPVDLRQQAPSLSDKEIAVRNSNRSVARKVAGGFVCTALGVAGIIGGVLLYKSEGDGVGINANPHIGSALLLAGGGVLSLSGLLSFVSASVEHGRIDYSGENVNDFNKPIESKGGK